MRITSKGQVTIPQEIREQFGLLPDTEVDFVVRHNSVQLVKTTELKRVSRGTRIVRRLRGAATVRMTTDQILSLTRK
ncbi:MAG TPA: AbrB/MazE/SpoVT family DNA-binding domain-containing protein [Thermoanaerobaculia bacterium]|jgi:AbrB family looped-hinge helix DNA binding protein